MSKKNIKIKNTKKFSCGGLWIKNKFKDSKNLNPLISIITVTYNSHKYLQETLDSLFKQNYKNFELIIIDGNSTDKTKNIIKKNKKNIDYWISENDKGIYDAFNKGIKLSRGDLIGIVNSDDILKPNALKILVKYYNSYPKMDFFFGINNNTFKSEIQIPLFQNRIIKPKKGTLIELPFILCKSPVT